MTHPTPVSRVSPDSASDILKQRTMQPEQKEHPSRQAGAYMKMVYEDITERERESLLMLSKGLTRTMAAQVLGCKPITEASHRRNIYRKFGVGSAAEAAVIAAKAGFV